MEGSDGFGLRMAGFRCCARHLDCAGECLALFVVVQVVSTVVRLVGDKYVGLLITHFQTYKIYVFTNTKHTKILKFSKIFSI